MSPSHDLIERLYGEHHHAVLRFARSRNQNLADDVVSETFAVALRRAEVIPPGAERAWLFGVADNVLRNLQRKEYRAASLPGVLRPHTPASTSAHEPPVVGPAMSDLPPTERDVLTLTAFEGLSSAEAGERLGLSPGSTRNAMVRARRNLAIQLGGFAVLLLVPVLFWLLRDRAEAQAPQAERLAQTLRRALTVETDTTVTTGGEPRRYTVSIDRATGRQRIALPGGGLAVGPLDEPAHVLPRAGVSEAERRRVARSNADALTALQTLTSGELERFLSQARRAGAQQRSTGSGAGQVTVIRGPWTTSDGRRVELRVTVAGEPAALRQLQIRPAGGSTWTTVDVRNWRVKMPAQGAAPAPSVASAAPRPGPSTPSPVAGPWKPAADPPAEAPPERSGPPPISARVAASNRAEVEAVPKYSGEAGAVLHVKSTTKNLDVTDTAHVSTGSTRLESWKETGGGQRFRHIFAFYDQRQRPTGTQVEDWGSPSLWAVMPRSPRGSGPDAPTSSSVALYCAPIDRGQAAPDEDAVALAAARADLASLPAGPEIRGHATRVMVRELSGWTVPAGAENSAAPTTSTYLDAASGVPLRRVFRSPTPAMLSYQTDYPLWEEIPAGGPDDQLAGTLPERFRLAKPDACPDGATLPALGAPSPGTAPVPSATTPVDPGVGETAMPELAAPAA